MSAVSAATDVDPATGADFSFPYDQPYDIQLQLMRALYTCVDGRRVGIFESPTGTGKSLSILCATLTWLRRYDERTRRRLTERVDEIRSLITSLTLDTDWVAAHAQQSVLAGESDQLREQRSALDEVDANVARIRSGTSARATVKRAAVAGDANDDDDAAFLASLRGESKDDLNDEFAPSPFTEEDSLSNADTDKVADPTPPPVQKIFYCSRTHSQLAQFLRELQRCRRFAADVRVVTLGSRASLCVNDAVTALGGAALINDRCMNMQQSTSGATKAAKVDVEDCHKKPCTTANKENTKSTRRSSKRAPAAGEDDVQLTRVRDMDGVLRLARSFDACAYYATRHTTLPLAQLVLAPYQILLHAQARRAWNIDVTDAVVIVDEAHNLFDAIAQMHQATLSLTHLRACQRHIDAYMARYGGRLTGGNLMYCRHLKCVVDRLLARLQSTAGVSSVSTLPAFLKSTSLDDVNMFKLLAYVDRAQLCRKLFGFAARYGHDDFKPATPTPRVSGVARLIGKTKPPTVPTTQPPSDAKPSAVTIHPSAIYSLKSFLEALCSPDDDGRVMIADGAYKYLLLNAASQFAPIVATARSVLLLGGTMSPSNILVDALQRDCGVTTERLTQFTCGHVIERDRLLPLVVARTPGGLPLTFTYATRSTDATVTALAQTLTQLAGVVPGGLVVFFASYDYMHGVCDKWTERGAMRRLTAITDVYTEPRASDATSVDTMLRAYAASIARAGRATLFAVVGGKMSEGINFADELGRCVVMVGMPYANKESADLKEKMKYLVAHTGHPSAGSDYYEALCMSAVNQCIGRVIRHQNDYASIVLLDARYGGQRIRGKLAGWIGKWVTVLDERDAQTTMIESMKQFYAKHK